MKTIEFVIEPQEAGQRLDSLLAQKAPELSRSMVQQLMEKGNFPLISIATKIATMIRQIVLEALEWTTFLFIFCP